MEYVENVMNLAQDGIGVNLVMLKDLRKILKLGLAATKISTNLYNTLNLTLYIVQNVLNGYLLKIFKMLFILPGEVLVKIYSADWPEGYIDCWDIENQKWFRYTVVKV